MKTASIAAAVLCSCALPAAAQQLDASKIEIKTTDLGHGVYLLGWPGGDSVVLTGPDGALLVDASLAQMADKITAAVARVSGKPIRYLVNSHAHADHFGGNEAIARAGAVIVAQDNVRARMARGWYIAAFRQVIPPQAPLALPAITYGDAMTLHFDGETVDLIHVPDAHTDSDSVIVFRNANVIHIGGAFASESNYPFYDLSSGGSLKGTIATQETVLRLADNNTRIITDEGDPESRRTLQASHDMLVKVRDRVQALIDAGKSEDEAVAARPTQDLDPIWAHKGSYITGDVATRMAYESLKGIKPPISPPAS